MSTSDMDATTGRVLHDSLDLFIDTDVLNYVDLSRNYVMILLILLTTIYVFTD